MLDLTGKVAVVTGSTKGIGKAIAEQMALAGAKVVVSSRKSEVCDEVARSINETVQGQSGEATAIPCHISHKDQLQNLVDETHHRFGKINVLVCNAGVNPFFGSIADIPDSAFEKIMDTNIKSNHWLCQMVLPDMLENKEGSIILVSSIAGLIGSSDLGAYGISKAADLAIVRNLAVEYGPHNIRTNAIAPGLIKTDFAKALWSNPEILETATKGSPLRRIGEPIEGAGAAVFLASEAASFITGQTLVIDGGGMIT